MLRISKVNRMRSQLRNAKCLLIRDQNQSVLDTLTPLVAHRNINPLRVPVHFIPEVLKLRILSTLWANKGEIISKDPLLFDLVIIMRSSLQLLGAIEWLALKIELFIGHLIGFGGVRSKHLRNHIPP